jgi:hypothetical protein
MIFIGLLIITALSFVRGAMPIQFIVLGVLAAVLLFSGLDPRHVGLMFGVPTLAALAFYVPLCFLVMLAMRKSFRTMFTRLRLLYFVAFDVFFLVVTFNLTSLVLMIESAP